MKSVLLLSYKGLGMAIFVDKYRKWKGWPTGRLKALFENVSVLPFFMLTSTVLAAAGIQIWDTGIPISENISQLQDSLLNNSFPLILLGFISGAMGNPIGVALLGAALGKFVYSILSKEADIARNPKFSNGYENHIKNFFNSAVSTAIGTVGYVASLAGLGTLLHYTSVHASNFDPNNILIDFAEKGIFSGVSSTIRDTWGIAHNAFSNATFQGLSPENAIVLGSIILVGALGYLAVSSVADHIMTKVNPPTLKKEYRVLSH